MNRHKWWGRVGAIGVLFGAAPSPMRAQTTNHDARNACFSIHPTPECRSYWIVEVQGVVPLASSRQHAPFWGDPEVFTDNNVEFNLGHMVNFDPGISVGASVTLGSGSGGAPDGARARARWWATPGFSLEAEAGAVRTNLGSRVGSPLLGPSVGVRVNLRDAGALLLRYDRVDIPSSESWVGGPAWGVSTGVSVSSGGALMASALIGLGLIVVLSIASAS